MKHELSHFQIGNSYGGNQDWFPTFMMRIGGCGAETACDSSIYFALQRGVTGIAPENAASLSKEDYIRFAYEMKPYLSPRMSGIDRLDIYIDGYAEYLQDRGVTGLAMTPFDGSEPYEKAREAVIRQIDRGYPIPMLVLKHRDKKFKDFVWHWFLINGYDDREYVEGRGGTGDNREHAERRGAGDDREHVDASDFLVKAVTYSHFEWLDFRGLWETGYEKRGGFVIYQIGK